VNDDELLARLQAADPALRAPAPAENWIDELTEATMTNTVGSPRRWTWLVAAAAAVVVAGVGGVALIGGPGGPTLSTSDKQPTVTQLHAPAPSDARCMVPGAGTLAANARTAFDGSVLSIEGDQVTMEVSHWYAGGPTDQVVVTAAEDDMQALIGAVDLQRGKRYLVAAVSDGQLMVCGFSAPYDRGLAAMYAKAFGP
jgi:hypothetical protein